MIFFGVHKSLRSRDSIKRGVRRLVFDMHGRGPGKNFRVHWTHSEDWSHSTSKHVKRLIMRMRAFYRTLITKERKTETIDGNSAQAKAVPSK